MFVHYVVELKLYIFIYICFPGAFSMEDSDSHLR